MDDPKNPKPKTSTWQEMENIFKDYEKSDAVRWPDLTRDQKFNQKPMKKYKITVGEKIIILDGTSIDNAFGRFCFSAEKEIKSATIQEYSEQDEMLDRLKSLQAEMDMIRVKLQGVEYGVLNKQSNGGLNKESDIKLGRTPDDGC